MKSSEYIDEVLKTESTDFVSVAERLSCIAHMRLLHATMGISTEAGELLDAVKKYVFYGKKLDKTNLIEELGDVMWYVAVAISVLQRTGVDVSFEDIWCTNINKLRLRYGTEFSEDRAINRELDKEREVLDGKVTEN